jgi:arsenate reductase
MRIMKCPATVGQLLRVPLHYGDPKAADGTPAEAAAYDERCLQVASEMFYLMSLVKTPAR